MKVGDKIRFTKTLDCGPTGDRPAMLYASKGETGEIVKVGGCREGFWVKTDSWPEPFGADDTEFVKID